MKSLKSIEQEQKYQDIIRQAQTSAISKVIDHVDIENVPLEFLEGVIPTLSTKETQTLFSHISSLNPTPRIIEWQDYLIKSIVTYTSPGLLVHKNGDVIDILKVIEATDSISLENMAKAIVSLEFFKRIDPSIQIDMKFLDKQLNKIGADRAEFLKLLTRLNNSGLLPSLNSHPKDQDIKNKIIRYLTWQSLNKTYDLTHPVKNFVTDIHNSPLSKLVDYKDIFDDTFPRLSSALDNYLANINVKLLSTNQVKTRQELVNFVYQIEDFINCHNKIMGDRQAFFNDEKGRLFSIKLLVFLEHIKNTDILKNRIINFHPDFKNRKTQDADFLIKKHPVFQSVNFTKISRSAGENINQIIKSLGVSSQVALTIGQEIAVINDYSLISNEFLEKLSLSISLINIKNNDNSPAPSKIKI